jgi:predicted negative regulator of RcsB-dependent stress response
MAVYDLEEQERLDALKDWWAQYRNAVYAAIGAIILAVAGVNAWRYYEKNQNEQAAALFKSVQKVAGENDAKKLSDAASALIERFPSTFYATEAALLAAKISFEARDFAAARSQLQWAADKGKAQFRPVAQLRLATVLLEEKKYDDALKVIQGVTDDGYLPLAADLKGDVLMAQGKKDEARVAYQLALDKADARSPIRQITQLKLDALGTPGEVK